MRSSDATGELFQALTVAVGQMKNPIKSERANAGKFSYTYADFAEIATDARDILNQHGLAALQEAVTENGQTGVTTRIIHVSGQWIEMGPLLLPGGQGPQDYGSALTYARRYALTSALLLAAEEDDDAAAGQAATKETARVRQPQPQGDGGGPPPADSPQLGVGGSTGSGKDPKPPHSKTCNHQWVDAPRQGFEMCSVCGDARQKDRSVLA